jgi:hypothetical protein
MSKHGNNKEIDKLTEEWLKANDPDYFKKTKTYVSEEQMQKKLNKERPLSSFNKKQKNEMDNKYYSIHKEEL